MTRTAAPCSTAAAKLPHFLDLHHEANQTGPSSSLNKPLGLFRHNYTPKEILPLLQALFFLVVIVIVFGKALLTPQPVGSSASGVGVSSFLRGGSGGHATGGQLGRDVAAMAASTRTVTRDEN